MAQTPIVASAATGTNAASHTTPSFTPSANRRMVVVAGSSRASAYPTKPTISDSGSNGTLNWQEVWSIQTPDATTVGMWQVCWVSDIVGSSPASMTVTVASTNATVIGTTIECIWGGDAATVVQAASAYDGSGNPSISFGSVPGLGNLALMTVWSRGSGVFTPPAIWTAELVDATSNTGYRYETVWSAGGAPQGPNQPSSTGGNKALGGVVEFSPGAGTPDLIVAANGTTSAVSAPFTPAANSLLYAVVAIARVGAQATLPTMSDSTTPGLTWTQLGDVETSNTTTADLRLTIFVSTTVGSTPASMTVTATSAGAAGTGMLVGRLDPAYTDGTVIQVASGEDLTAGDPSFSLVSVPDPARILLGATYALGNNDILPPVGIGELTDGNLGSTRLQIWAKPGGPQTGQATSTNTRSIILAIELAAASAPAQTLTPSLFSDSQSFYAPTVSAGAVTLAPPLLTNAATFYAPSVQAGAVALAPPLLANSPAFYAPTVSLGGVTLAPSVLTNTATFPVPTVTAGAVTLSAPVLSNSATFPTATVTATYVLSAARFNAAQQFYGPVVTTGPVALTPGLFTSGQTFYAPTVSQGSGPQTLSPALFSAGQTFYSPTVQRGAVTLSPALATNVQAFFAPVVTAGAVALSAPLLSNAQTFFAPTIGRGAIALLPARLDDADTFFPATISLGSVTLLADLFADGDLFYPPAVSARNNVAAPLITNGVQFFAPAVSARSTLAPLLFVDPDQFFEALIQGGRVYETPASRLIVIPAESRVTAVPAEDRVITL